MSTEEGSHFFPSAVNPRFINSMFASVGGDYHTHYPSSKSDHYGLYLLLDHISRGAFHNAAERSDPPKCHPHTRTVILAEIMDWVKASKARRKLIIWMHGPAGCGKTAISQSIAEECEKEGLLAASFFFLRTATGCNNTSRFVATIAYQVTQFIPEIEDRLITTIEQDPAIFSRTLSAQMQELVVGPLICIPTPPTPIFVLLDGIDECGPDVQSQANLLDVLSTTISKLQHIPLIFLISSRPEYEIREAFNGNLLSSLTQPLVLDDIYEPDNDIKLYLASKFRQIQDKHLRLGSRLPVLWPTESDINHLVVKASGQFIFAATVVKFIDNPRHRPTERLDIILGLSAPGKENPFALLDALYHFILSSVTDLPKVLQILALLMLAGNYRNINPLKTEVVEELLCFEVRSALVDMHALVFVPSPDDNESELRIYHASLYDFLTDRCHSHDLYNDLYIDINQGHIALSQCWLRIIANYQISKWQAPLWSCIKGFIYHCKRSPARSEIADDLASLDLRQILERIDEFTDLYESEWSAFFTYARNQAGDRSDVFPRLQNEFDAFILERLSKYPPALQNYIPTILTHSVGVYYAVDIFRILIYVVTPSQKEFEESRILDSTLLYLDSGDVISRADGAFPALFQDPSRAGQYYVDGESYVKLMKQIVGVIFPKSGEHKRQVQLEWFARERHQYLYFYDSEGARPTMRTGLSYLGFGWFPDMLSEASPDPELALLLRKRALQYRADLEPIPSWEKIAKASLEYIKRSGIPYLNHTHLPDTNTCVICDECDNSFIVDSDSSILPSTPEASSVAGLITKPKQNQFARWLTKLFSN